MRRRSLENQRSQETSVHRIVVIGSGPAGAMAALQLSRRGIPVTLVESGSQYPTGGLIRLRGCTVFRRRPALSNGDGHVASGDLRTSWYHYFNPGGLSNQWTGAVPRFAPEDFFEGERLHEMYRWPVTYDELVPYYEAVERMLQVTGGDEDVPNLPAGLRKYPRTLPDDWRSVAQHAEACGHGLTVQPVVDGGPWMLVRRGTAFNSFTEIEKNLKTLPHLQLITGAHVSRLEWCRATGKVTGLVYQDRISKDQRLLEADAVVLAAGPLSSTKILLNSTSPDFPEGLGNTHGVLGHYLHDHPKEWWIIDLDKPISHLAQPAYLTRAAYSTSAPLMATQCVIGHASRGDRIRSLVSSRGHSLGVLVLGTMLPRRSNYVSIHGEMRDRFGQPLLDIQVNFGEEVLQNMAAAREQLTEIFARAGYRVTIREIGPQLEPGASVHYGGTVRMHHSPECGMLDAWNRLHAVPNVLVTDASCFTTGVEKNPTLTVMALAARAADRLANDLAGG